MKNVRCHIAKMSRWPKFSFPSTLSHINLILCWWTNYSHVEVTGDTMAVHTASGENKVNHTRDSTSSKCSVPRALKVTILTDYKPGFLFKEIFHWSRRDINIFILLLMSQCERGNNFTEPSLFFLSCSTSFLPNWPLWHLHGQKSSGQTKRSWSTLQSKTHIKRIVHKVKVPIFTWRLWILT